MKGSCGWKKYSTCLRLMAPNPALGVVFHWLGGFAAGTFYVPIDT